MYVFINNKLVWYLGHFLLFIFLRDNGETYGKLYGRGLMDQHQNKLTQLITIVMNFRNVVFDTPTLLYG